MANISTAQWLHILGSEGVENHGCIRVSHLAEKYGKSIACVQGMIRRAVDMGYPIRSDVVTNRTTPQQLQEIADGWRDRLLAITSPEDD